MNTATVTPTVPVLIGDTLRHYASVQPPEQPAHDLSDRTPRRRRRAA